MEILKVLPLPTVSPAIYISEANPDMPESIFCEVIHHDDFLHHS